MPTPDGEIELEGHTLVVKRIAVTYRLAVDQNTDHAGARAAARLARRALSLICSIDRSIDTTTQVEYTTAE